jgi:hypothetical protein
VPELEVILRTPKMFAALVMRTAWERCEQPPEAKTVTRSTRAMAKLDNAYDNLAEGRSEGYEKPSSTGQQDGVRRRLAITKASSIELKATQWLWEDEYGCWIPMGASALLGGRESVGKSTLCAHLIAQVTTCCGRG